MGLIADLLRMLKGQNLGEIRNVIREIKELIILLKEFLLFLKDLFDGQN